MDYNHKDVEARWQKYWAENKTFVAEADHSRPKFYILDMFPYPSGAGLHVGHPLGYIASDIVARYKRMKGFNVLHPMGYDAFGLPAEQYAIETGQHPAITTEQNIRRYRSQLDKLGFSFDWEREVRTSDPAYYKWTQWTFVRIFNSWFDLTLQKARPIEELQAYFMSSGNAGISAAHSCEMLFTAAQWKAMSASEQAEVLMQYRLAYLADTLVNWCPALGTVLANDEVSEGFSVRGGHPVERKKMKQWSLRISAYADRLLEGLERIDWPENIKEIQRNWIGRSEGAMLKFFLADDPKLYLEIFTTRPDTIFGVTFMSVAPEHEYVSRLTTAAQAEAVEEYVRHARNRSERERMADAKQPSGVFTGSYAIHPFTGKAVPIWVADYVLGGYGTGAVMAVPAHDSRDYAFAKHYGLPIVEVIKGGNIAVEAFESKDGICMNSDFINGLIARDAIGKVIEVAEQKGLGYRKTNYRLRDAIFSRQRYWGEPFPVYYKDGVAVCLEDHQLPLELPPVDAYLPTASGEPPLARASNWSTAEGYPFETSTMPGFAGSSAYYFRYMDPQNADALVSKEAVEYWRSVDFYVGGAEHATGHLIYARFWNKFLSDIGLVPEDEPFRKMINQGMIQGRSNFVYRVKPEEMAEFVLWEMIKNKQLGTEFIKDYRDGEVRFDFFSNESRILIEIKRNKSLERILDDCAVYAAGKGYRLLLFSIVDVILHTDEVLHKIRKAVSGKEVQAFEEIEQWEEAPIFVSKNVYGREHYSFPVHVDVNLVSNDVLDVDLFRNWRPEYRNARFIFEGDRYHCGYEVEKMSKSKYNVQNPDDLVERYGADTLRMYEMFLGPVEQSKPWDTNGIEGVSRFVRKLWRLYINDEDLVQLSDDEPTEAELKTLHKTIKKTAEDIDRFSLNTCISTLMICVNELTELSCRKKAVLEPFVKVLAPFAPHIAEELWQRMGHSESISKAAFPEFNEQYLVENTVKYPVSFNGKMRFLLELPSGLTVAEIEKAILSVPESQKYLEGKTPKKLIVVPGKIVNVVV